MELLPAKTFLHGAGIKTLSKTPTPSPTPERANKKEKEPDPTPGKEPEPASPAPEVRYHSLVVINLPDIRDQI